MLDIFIIQKIREEEERRRREQERPRLEVPIHEYPEEPINEEKDEEPQRGVIIIDPDEG
jgi:hypothetical protein